MSIFPLGRCVSMVVQVRYGDETTRRSSSAPFALQCRRSSGRAHSCSATDHKALSSGSGGSFRMSLRLRSHRSAGSPEPDKGYTTLLRTTLSAEDWNRPGRSNEASTVQAVGGYAGSLLQPGEQVISGLRCAGHHGLRAVALRRRSVVGLSMLRRGYGRCSGSNTGAQRPNRKLRAPELRVGKSDSPIKESPFSPNGGMERGNIARLGLGRANWHQLFYIDASTKTWLVSGSITHRASSLDTQRSFRLETQQ